MADIYRSYALPPNVLQDLMAEPSDPQVFYHGTVLPFAHAIINEGLRENTSQKFFNALIHPYSHKNLEELALNERGYVFLSSRRDVAEDYAIFRSQVAAAKAGDALPFRSIYFKFTKKDVPLQGGAPAIVEVTLPFAHSRLLEEDPEDHTGWRAKHIPPHHISNVFVHENESWNQIWTRIQPRQEAIHGAHHRLDQ